MNTDSSMSIFSHYFLLRKNDRSLLILSIFKKEKVSLNITTDKLKTKNYSFIATVADIKYNISYYDDFDLKFVLNQFGRKIVYYIHIYIYI